MIVDIVSSLLNLFSTNSFFVFLLIIGLLSFVFAQNSEPVNECPLGETKCNNVCTNLYTDESNCGACGVQVQSNFTCIEGGAVCNSPFTLCTGMCVDLQTDENNCGSCGTLTPSDAICTNGNPICSDTTLAACNGVCVDLQTNTSHCGACNEPVYSNGTCTGGTKVCNSFLDLCDENKCVDLQTDSSHCGQCNLQIPANSMCSYGNPLCNSNFKFCNGSTTECTDLSTNENCGDCGVNVQNSQCLYDGQYYRPVCFSGYKFCTFSNDCVDMNTKENCGDCEITLLGDATCENSVPKCPEGKGFCNPPFAVPGPNQCIDLTTRENCGSCGNDISSVYKSVCIQQGSQYVPACEDFYKNCGSDSAPFFCTDLRTNANCGDCESQVPPNSTCVNNNGQYEYMCNNNFEVCGDPLDPDPCIDLFTDVNNCGSCDNAPGSGGNINISKFCENGSFKCTNDPYNNTNLYSYCEDGCYDINNDSYNCGSCGNIILVEGGGSCQMGSPFCSNLNVNGDPQINNTYCIGVGCVDFSMSGNCGQCGITCDPQTESCLQNESNGNNFECIANQI